MLKVLKPAVTKEEIEVRQAGGTGGQSSWQEWEIEENEGMWVLPIWGPSEEEVEATMHKAAQLRQVRGLGQHDEHDLGHWVAHVTHALGRNSVDKGGGKGAMHIAVASVALASGLPLHLSETKIRLAGGIQKSKKDLLNFKSKNDLLDTEELLDFSQWDDIDLIVTSMMDSIEHSVRATFGDHQIMIKDILLLLCSAYVGANESMLLASTTNASMPALLLLLRELQPLLMNPGGLICPIGILRSYVEKKYSDLQTFRCLHNSLRLTKGPVGVGGGRRDSLNTFGAIMRCPAEIPSLLTKFRSATDVAGLKAVLVSVQVFLTAYHSIYFYDYLALWNQFSLTNGSDLSVELRISAERYVRTLGSDGNGIEDENTSLHVRFVHLLEICWFLIDIARFPAQAKVLLETILEPGVNEKCGQIFAVPVALQRAKVLAETSSVHNAVRILSAALNAEPQAAKLPDTNGQALQLWRERAYVQGFLKDSHLAAWRTLGEMAQSTGQLQEVDECRVTLCFILRSCIC